MLSAFAQLTNEVAQLYGLRDSVVVTNDWTGGLVAHHCKSRLPAATFMHIVHNLEEGYQGKTYLPVSELRKALQICGLSNEELEHSDKKGFLVNPSLVALQASDSWGTVSRTYLWSLIDREGSITSKHSAKSFGWSNGIDRQGVVRSIKQKLGIEEHNALNWETHLKAKRVILEHYFTETFWDDDVMLVSTIGRITDQKQSLEFLRTAESLFKKYGSKLRILIGGNDSPTDPYGARCREIATQLKQRYPKLIWADPSKFFDEHKAELLHGSDFGVMFSKFEPGGLVQLEYLAASTPVLVTRTGGLLDTVRELSHPGQEGNGYFIEPNNEDGLRKAIAKAYQLYLDPERYKHLRLRSFDTALDMEYISRKYLDHMYKLKRKVFIDQQAKPGTNILSQFYQNQTKPAMAIRIPEEKRSRFVECLVATSAEPLIPPARHKLECLDPFGSNYSLCLQPNIESVHFLILIDGTERYLSPDFPGDMHPTLGYSNTIRLVPTT